MHCIIVNTLRLRTGAIKTTFNHMAPEYKRVTAHERIHYKILRMCGKPQSHHGFNILPDTHLFNSTSQTQFFHAFSFLQDIILQYQGY